MWLYSCWIIKYSRLSDGVWILHPALTQFAPVSYLHFTIKGCSCFSYHAQAWVFLCNASWYSADTAPCSVVLICDVSVSVTGRALSHFHLKPSATVTVPSVSLCHRQLTIQRCMKSYPHYDFTTLEPPTYFKSLRNYAWGLVTQVACFLLPAVPCVLILGSAEAISVAQWAH